jgi:hypothetical protein
MCILVTSGGRIAAPGPSLTASSWRSVNEESDEGCGRIENLPSAVHGQSVLYLKEPRGNGIIRGIEWVTYCSQLPHTLYYAHHLEGLGY